MQVVMVIAEPRTAAGARLATNAENWGESATTINPQNIMNTKNRIGENDHIHGESRQHAPDEISATRATFLLPKRNDNLPPTTHPTAPAAMIMNASNDADAPGKLCGS